MNTFCCVYRKEWWWQWQIKNIGKNLTINTNTNGSLIHFTVTDTTTRTIYKIAYANGVVQGDKTVNFAGYTLYLDTLDTNVELNAQTTLQNYQTIIAYKKY